MSKLNMSKYAVALLVLSSGVRMMFFRGTKMKPNEMSRRLVATHNLMMPTTTDDSLSISTNDYLAQELNASAWSIPSPACQPRFLERNKLPQFLERNKLPIRRIFFLHMRKAAGTVIHKYLNKVAHAYGIKVEYREGKRTVEHPMDPHTLYVTNLREPNERTISHYKYDQRWHCRNLKKSSFEPTLNNTKQSFENFLYKADQRNRGRKSLWTCATNCYTRWATGDYKPLLREEEVQRVRQARNQLQKFNFIFIVDKLRDPHYIQMVERMFGVPGLAAKKVYPACARVSAQANAKFPLVLSNDERRQLEECNMPDTALYRQMTTCPHGFDFSQFNMSLFVNK